MDIDRNELETGSYETRSYETKSGIPLDAGVTHAEMMRAFEEFRETNDQRLALSQKRVGESTGLRSLGCCRRANQSAYLV
jgi:hypothetical protein